ncbi:hypothetical protein JCM10449v2_003533 [Rhodotorula kratochvilovae]
MLALLLRVPRHVLVRALRLALRKMRKAFRRVIKGTGVVLALFRAYFHKTSYGTFRNLASARKVSLLPFAPAGKTLPAVDRESIHHVVEFRPLEPIEELEEPAGSTTIRSISPPTPALTTDSGDSLDSPFLSTPIPTPVPFIPHLAHHREDKHAAHDYQDGADDSLEGVLGAPSLFSPTFVSPAPSSIRPSPNQPILLTNVVKYAQVAHLEAPRVEHNQGLVDFDRFEALAEDEAFLAECIPYAAPNYADVYEPAALSPLELLTAQVQAGRGGVGFTHKPRAVPDYPLPPPSHATWTSNKVDYWSSAAGANLAHLATLPSTGSGASARFARRLSSIPASPVSSASSDLWGTPYEVALFGTPPDAAEVPLEDAFPAFCLGAAELSHAPAAPYGLSSLLSPFSDVEARVKSPCETVLSPLPFQRFTNVAEKHTPLPLIAPRPQRPDGWMPIAQWEELAEEATYPFLNVDPSPRKDDHLPRELAGSAVKLGAADSGGAEACELAWPEGQGFDFRWTYGMV